MGFKLTLNYRQYTVGTVLMHLEVGERLFVTEAVSGIRLDEVT